ncbi:hypothetical protein [Borrelia sp. RT5S]|uniref:hypothetical protein n=1 Tax=Borrelia sp. RT5S TaxID=2898581 RepID=UPI001E2C9236|nr:hypothetical protein [Borrelia sp. RT5S]UGQ16712.1 hypothetical protein LSO06_05175 [Borrelia sp. RT5S]
MRFEELKGRHFVSIASKQRRIKRAAFCECCIGEFNMSFENQAKEDELPPLDGTSDTREVLLQQTKESLKDLKGRHFVAAEEDEEYTPDGACSLLLQATLNKEELQEEVEEDLQEDDEILDLQERRI